MKYPVDHDFDAGGKLAGRFVEGPALDFQLAAGMYSFIFLRTRVVDPVDRKRWSARGTAEPGCNGISRSQRQRHLPQGPLGVFFDHDVGMFQFHEALKSLVGRANPGKIRPGEMHRQWLRLFRKYRRRKERVVKYQKASATPRRFQSIELWRWN